MKQSKKTIASVVHKGAAPSEAQVLKTYGYLDSWTAVPVLLAGILIGLLIRRLRTEKRITANGYVRSISISGRSRYEHREIAERILGRRLEKWEVVHHINGQRMDNRIENLCVMDRIDHDRYHAWYQRGKKEYGKPARRDTQLRELREQFNGMLLLDLMSRKNRAG